MQCYIGVLTKGNNEEKWFHALIRIDKYEPIYRISINCTIWILSFHWVTLRSNTLYLKYKELQRINEKYVSYIVQDKIILQNDWYLQTRSCISNPTSYTKLTRHMLHISKKKARFILQRKYNFVVIRVYVSKHRDRDVAMQICIYYSHLIFKDFTIPLVYALNNLPYLLPKKSQIDL